MAITSPGNEAVPIFMLGDQCSKEVINLGLSQKNKEEDIKYSLENTA